MVATLQLRKEALEARIHEKTAELKRLCLEEADLTGILPPETPLEPGEPPPTIRRRVGTSFSFPQNLINNMNGCDDHSLQALELECKVQTNIAEAALAIANDTNGTKSVRRKHRMLYRQSQQQLVELETRLSLLRQGKHQPMKPQQVKKKPRPNTTSIDHLQIMQELKGQGSSYLNHGSWSIKSGNSFGEDELRHFSSLHRPSRSSGTSQSSNSPRLSAREIAAFNSSGLPDHYPMISSSLSQPNIQDIKPLPLEVNKEIRRSDRRNSGRKQWDSQSAGGTLLPNQTYPESHQPNLNRTQSLGSVDGQRQGNEKEKEWYETSLDSAPSPPLRTSSRLPSSTRMLYQMQEMQIRDAVNRSLIAPRPHPTLTRTHRATPVDDMTNALQGMLLAPRTSDSSTIPSTNNRHSSAYSVNESIQGFESPLAHMVALPSDIVQPRRAEVRHSAEPVRHSMHNHSRHVAHSERPHVEHNAESHRERLVERRNTGGTPTFHQPDQTKSFEARPTEMQRVYETRSSDAVYIDIPNDEIDSAAVRRPVAEGTKTPTQPYYHHGGGWSPSVPGLPEVHPPHAATQEEITFDTVVPFESPQNHTVVQAGIWQPYREVTKPFEMSDFYKYSTKFRQARQSPGPPQPAEQPLNSPSQEQLSPNPLVGRYQPLRPMTCKPVEHRPTPMYNEPPPPRAPSSVHTPKMV